MTPEERQEARSRIKHQLSAYHARDLERAQIKDQLEEVEARLLAAGSPNMDGMPKGGKGGDMADRVARHLALLDRYNRALADLSRAQAAVERLIEGLEPTERKLLRHRYIEGLTWEVVCVRMSYCWKQTHKIHARALDKLVDKENPEL